MKILKLIYISIFLLIITPTLFSQSPIFYFPFNGNTIDESGNGNTCLNVGAKPTIDRFGNKNSAFEFDGISSFMRILPVSDLSSLGDYTLTLWIEHYSFNNNYNPKLRQYIFTGFSSSETATQDIDQYKQGFSLYYDSISTTINKKISISDIYSVPPSLTYFDANNTFELSKQWHFLIIQRKGNLHSMYIDGKQVSVFKTSNSGNELSQHLNMQHDLFIGNFAGLNSSSNFAGYNFNGKIDDIRLFNREIDESEILSLYTEGNITISYNILNEKNGNDGAIDINVTGGKSPYNYAWSNNQTSEDLTNIVGATYTVTVTDANNYSILDSFTVYSKLSISKIVTNEISGNDGAINLTIKGGKSPYSYIWSNGEKTKDIRNLIEGFYSVTVSDALNTNAFEMIEVKAPKNTLSISGSVITNEGVFNDGIVILYKQNQNQISAYDFQNIGSDGSYSFLTLNEGNYLIQIVPNHGKSSKYISSYFYNSNNWVKANRLVLTGQASNVKIKLIESQNYVFNGKCTINGKVNIQDSIYHNLFLKKGIIDQNIIVYLFQNGNIISSTLTNILGEYKFINVPIGKYEIKAEHAGYNSISSEINIDNNDTEINNNQILIEKALISFFQEFETDYPYIYPNPVQNILNISLVSDIQILSIDGKKLIQTQNTNSVNISELPKGIYFINIKKSDISIWVSFLKD